MKREEYLAALIEQGYGSIYKFSKETGMPNSTLRFILTSGVNKTSIENLEKMCAALGITVDHLLSIGQNEEVVQDMPMLLTDEHEKSVMKKYRDTPEMQSAVDRLLGV